MYAAQLNSLNQVVEIFVVRDLTALPNLIDGTNAVVGATWNGSEFIIPPYIPSKEEHNNGIKAKLAAVDMKSIRALRENDTTYITQYAQEAADLRAQLIP